MDSLNYTRTAVPFLFKSRSGIFLTFRNIDFGTQQLVWLNDDGDVVREQTEPRSNVMYAFASGDTVTLMGLTLETLGDSTHFDLEAYNYNSSGDHISSHFLDAGILGPGYIVSGSAFDDRDGEVLATVFTADANESPVEYTVHAHRYSITGGAVAFPERALNTLPLYSYVDYWALSYGPWNTMIYGYHVALESGSEFKFQAVDETGTPQPVIHTVALNPEQNDSGLDILVSGGTVYAMYETFAIEGVENMGSYVLGFPLETILDSPAPRAVPAKIALAAYPNPFNPETTIPFRLTRSGAVSVKIFNLLGEELATLAEGFRAAGDYEIHWNAGDLPSGIYLAKVAAEHTSRVQKLVLMK